MEKTRKILNNGAFIKEYGKYEFYDMCRYIPQDLMIAKANRKIKYFKVNNSKKIVKFYTENNNTVFLDFATIFSIGVDNINNYIERKILCNK